MSGPGGNADCEAKCYEGIANTVTKQVGDISTKDVSKAAGAATKAGLVNKKDLAGKSTIEVAGTVAKAAL